MDELPREPQAAAGLARSQTTSVRGMPSPHATRAAGRVVGPTIPSAGAATAVNP